MAVLWGDMLRRMRSAAGLAWSMACGLHILRPDRDGVRGWCRRVPAGVERQGVIMCVTTPALRRETRESASAEWREWRGESPTTGAFNIGAAATLG